ncbi:hypothetical protein HFC70_14470 [Agrobacterium sp. a22-2]|uniref:hypothetical protein n=1 Tax=Agrobacterium sp. a22-2 TaxID=2283840 RepID=UPI001445CDDD|nr:hypothetical protein [Agrobacterium sp. a22-2]NKN37554.1 hypothetical protein [Agrobacterium sp. a22-2]
MFQEEIAHFVQSPVMQIIGTADDQRRPEIGRGAGGWVSMERGIVEMVVSAWQWPGTITNLRQNGRVAVTFSRPSDYESYQIKGDAILRPANAEEIERSSRYLVDIVSTLMRLGLSAEIISPWLSNRDPMLIAIQVSSIFVQTPGAKAGTRLWSRGS